MGPSPEAVALGCEQAVRVGVPLAIDGFAVVAVLHSRKGRGTTVETIAGSVGISGDADHIVRVQRSKLGKRVRDVDFVTRLSEAESMHLEFSLERVWSHVAGTSPGDKPPGAQA
jgi:hypothetical protein